MMIEIERQKKVIDMMITAHSILKERYLLLSSFYEIVLLIAAAILNALIFVDDRFILKVTNISPDTQRITIGIASIIVFSISIILLKVNWKEKAASHAQTAEQLFILLQECRAIISLEEGEAKVALIIALEKNYLQVSTTPAKIPDRQFNALKLRHYRKIELSKLIERHPASQLWILRLKLFISSFKN